MSTSPSSSPDGSDLERNWRGHVTSLYSQIGCTDQSAPRLLSWPDCVYKAALTSMPRDLILYHVIESMRSLSECASIDSSSGSHSNNAKEREINDVKEKNLSGKPSSRAFSSKFESRLRRLLLIDDVEEDDVDGYKSLRKMDITLSNGDPGNVARIIKEGYRDTLTEEAIKISSHVPAMKIYHKDVGSGKAKGGVGSVLSANHVESAIFILLDKKCDPGGELRRQLTTIKVK